MSADTKNRKRFCLEHIEISVRFQIPLKTVKWGDRSNFKKACKKFPIEDG